MTGGEKVVESAITRRSKFAQITSDVGKHFLKLQFVIFLSSKSVSNEVWIVIGYSYLKNSLLTTRCGIKKCFHSNQGFVMFVKILLIFIKREKNVHIYFI